MSLHIFRSSRFQGSVKGGDDVLLFTSEIYAGDIQVEFFWLDQSTHSKWQAWAQVDKSSIHGNCALAIETPSFPIPVSGRVKVCYRLFRPSDSKTSDTCPFYYWSDFNEYKCLFGADTFNNSKLSPKRKLDAIDDPSVDLDMLTIQLKKKIHTNTSADRLDIGFADAQSQTDPLSTPHANIQTMYDSCVAKMESLANRTANAIAAFAKTRSVYSLLLPQRFLLTSAFEAGNTPLHLSILYGNFDIMAVFLQLANTIAFKNIINLQNQNGQTPLLVACYLNELEACEYLLEAGADSKISDSNGNTPIHVACKNKNLNILKVILKRMHQTGEVSNLNLQDLQGFTPLHIAVQNNSLDIVQELMYNIDHLRINMPDRRTGYTPLHYAACDQSRLKICNLLCKAPNIDLDALSYCGYTPLHIAAINKNYLISLCLVYRGANTKLKAYAPISSSGPYCRRENDILRKCLNTVDSFKLSAKKPDFEQLSSEISSATVDIAHVDSRKVYSLYEIAKEDDWVIFFVYFIYRF